MSLVFQNLFSNAIKFRQPGRKPCIHIEARKEAGEWRYRCATAVSDLTRSTPKRSLAPSRGCMARAEYPGYRNRPGDLQVASSKGMAAASGRRLILVPAPRFTLRCRNSVRFRTCRG